MIADYKKTRRTRWAGAMLLIAILACIVLTNAYVAKADFTFGTVTNLGPIVNSSSGESRTSMSTDGLELYFDSGRTGGRGLSDIWVTTRETRNDPWREPVNLGLPFNTTSHDFAPSISSNGLEFYFASNRSGAWDLWVTMRTDVSDSWGEAVNLGPTVNSSGVDAGPCISANGLELFFFSYLRPGGYGEDDLWVTTRSTLSDAWGAPVNLGRIVNSSAGDGSPSISSDGLVLFFESQRSGGYGDWDIWVTRRATLSDPWGEPVNLGPIINTTSSENLPHISFDGMELYFSDYGKPRPHGNGGADIWKASILPIVDFNGDGNIDTDDLVILVNNWGTNESLCDIGPTPFGDGIVDMEDLKVFMSYWEQENMPAVPADEQ